MISFTILTDTPAELRTRLIERSLLLNQPGVVYARDGMEHVEIPSPFAGLRSYAVKVVRAAEADEIAGEVQDDRLIWQRTKLGKWVLANSVAQTLTATDGRTLRTRRVGTSFWLAREDDASQFHEWL